jgi:DNA-binding beta-propeller fold protein YncE
MAAPRSALLAPLVVAGLLLPGHAPAVAPAPAVDLVWPSPPSSPRLRWIGAISSERDAGARRSWLDRVRVLVTGESAPRLGRPLGLWAGADGSYLVCDPASRTVYEGRPGRFRVLVSGGRLATPVGVARVGSEVWVSDADRGVVARYDARGAWKAEFGGGRLIRPTGVAWDAARQRFYVADAQAHLVAVFDGRGAHVADLGRRGVAAGEFNFPTDVKVIPGGELLVCDALNCRVQRLTAEGRPLAAFGHAGDARGDLARPKAVAMDSEGHIYVVDSLHDVLQVFDGEGRLLLSVGGTGIAPGRFNLPAGIAIGADDRVYIADSANGRVQVFQYLATGTGGMR